MAEEGPKRGSRGLQQGPPEGSKRELGTKLAESPLRDPPRPLLGPSRGTPGPPPESDFDTNEPPIWNESYIPGL